MEASTHMELFQLRVFLTVASERSFSRAAEKLYRTQSAVSQSVRRLEDELKEPLFDRSAKDGRLTEAGRVLKEYAERVLRLSEEAGAAVRDLTDLKRGRVLIGSNEAGVEALIPIIERCRERHPGLEFDVRRVPARQTGFEVAQGTLDFGVVTFHPLEPGLRSLIIGADELVVLSHPRHPFARRDEITMEEFGKETVIAHNDPSPARERVLRRFEELRTPLNIRVSLPSLAGVMWAVERRMGVALLPRRCALAEIEAGRLAATRIAQLRLPRDVRLVYRRAGNYSKAALELLAVAHDWRLLAGQPRATASGVKQMPRRAAARKVRAPRSR